MPASHPLSPEAGGGQRTRRRAQVREDGPRARARSMRPRWSVEGSEIRLVAPRPARHQGVERCDRQDPRLLQTVAGMLDRA
jgi:hypothetical protein